MADPYSDQHRATFQDIKIIYAGQDITRYVVFRETSFSSVSGAQPGTCNIVLRNEGPVQGILDSGTEIIFNLDGEPLWRGFGMLRTYGYWFSNKAEPKITIQGSDLNVLLDRFIIYNHTDPTKWPTGGGHYVKAITGLLDGGVPQGENDRHFIMASLQDTDCNLTMPFLRTGRISEIGSVAPDGPGSTLSAGSTIRALLEEAASKVAASQPGSIQFYVDPKRYIVYRDIDSASEGKASFSDEGGVDIAVRDLEIVKDASHLKNDVLVFAGSLDPRPTSEQKYLKYAHRYSASSISQYGRFQHGETIPAWSSASVAARAKKIVDQERTPGLRITFSTYKPGLYPDDVITVTSTAHGLAPTNVPIRQLTTTFETQNLARFQVTASYDTNDPYGILLAMKRPGQRGLVQPRLQSLELKPGDQPPYAELYTHIEERPVAKGGGNYQCSYAYHPHSLNVYVNRNRMERLATDAGSAGTAEFIETSPAKGQFKTGASGTIWVAYHVSANL
jgi:hypothetical protein